MAVTEFHGDRQIKNGTVAKADLTSTLQDEIDDKVVGPASSTDNAIARFDGTTGKLVQSSDVYITDTGRLGVGSEAPNQSVHIKDGSSGASISFGGVLVENDNSVSLTLLTPNNRTGSIFFADPDGTLTSSVAGQIEYSHINDSLMFRTNSTDDQLVLDASGNLTVAGNVDGRDVSADGSKLDGIESNATADQTNAEIKTAYEANANTNAYTDTEKTKLTGIETGAEVNNISDANATDLTDAGDSALHFHSTDRDRANHTGTQTMSTISDAGDLATKDIVAAADIATNAITLGYAQRTTDFSSSASHNVVQAVTGLSIAVTIPSGGRRVKITAYVGYFEVPGLTSAELSIWDGTVGSGTQLNLASATQNTNTYRVAPLAMAIVTPAAGAKTYNIGIRSSANTQITGKASATQPAFILVETI